MSLNYKNKLFSANKGEKRGPGAGSRGAYSGGSQEPGGEMLAAADADGVTTAAEAPVPQPAAQAERLENTFGQWQSLLFIRL